MIRHCNHSVITISRSDLCSLKTPNCGISQPYLYQRRTFFDTLLKSGLGECPLRSLSHTRTIPYSSKLTFQAVADVSGYPTFLPFTISSQVTSKDKLGYPTRARLRIGYEKFGLEENWDSIVHCDPEKGIIEARSSEQGRGGLFEILKTKWYIRENGSTETLVQLDVDVKFKNIIYDQMFAQVEGKVASSMISAFENKIQKMDTSK